MPVDNPSPGRDDWPEDSFIALLSEAERDAMLSAGTSVRFSDDEILVAQGEIGDFLFVLTHGLVKVVVAAETGLETALAVRSRGDLVGEFGMLDYGPRTATIRAVGAVAAVKVGRAAYDVLTGQYPGVLTTTTRYLLAKMRASDERRAAERFFDARARLAQVVCALAEAYGEQEPAGTVRLPFTQSEVGQLAGVAVSTAERVLAEFRGTGAIATTYGAIVVRNLAFLKKMRFSADERQTPEHGECRLPGFARVHSLGRLARGGGPPPSPRELNYFLAKGSSSYAGTPTIPVREDPVPGGLDGMTPDRPE